MTTHPTLAPRTARSVMLHRLEACARKYPDFPPAAVWLDDLDAIEAEASPPPAEAVEELRAAVERERESDPEDSYEEGWNAALDRVLYALGFTK